MRPLSRGLIAHPDSIEIVQRANAPKSVALGQWLSIE